MTSTTMTTIAMPQLGESVTEGMVGNWLKQVGERVEKYEPICEVTTDKVNSEIPSPVAGVLVEILVEPETTVPIGTGICRIDETGIAGMSALESLPPSPPLEWSQYAGRSVPLRTERAEFADEAELLRARSSPVVRRI